MKNAWLATHLGGDSSIHEGVILLFELSPVANTWAAAGLASKLSAWPSGGLQSKTGMWLEGARLPVSQFGHEVTHTVTL